MKIAQELAQHLRGCAVPESLIGTHAEKPFQLWAGDRTREWVSATGRRLVVKVEQAGGGVPPIRLFGTSFWPDIAVESSTSQTALAIEVKCVTRSGLPDSFATSVGQSMIYRAQYAECLIALFVVSLAKRFSRG